MKAVIEIKNKARKGDILMFDGEGYINVSFEKLVADIKSNLSHQTDDLRQVTDQVNKNIKDIKLLKGED